MKDEKDLFYVTIANQNARVKFVFDTKGKLLKNEDLKSILPQSILNVI